MPSIIEDHDAIRKAGQELKRFAPRPPRGFTDFKSGVPIDASPWEYQEMRRRAWAQE